MTVHRLLGIIDIIATDHAPHSIEDKERDFKNSSCGMIGLESAFALVNTTLKKEKMDIENIIDLFTIKPSKIMNIIPNSISVGSIAELNVIDTDCDWKFNVDNIYSIQNLNYLNYHNLLYQVQAASVQDTDEELSLAHALIFHQYFYGQVYLF